MTVKVKSQLLTVNFSLCRKMAAADPDLAHRMFAAKNYLERALGRDVTFDDLGVMVAHEQGRVSPYAASVTSRWIKASQEPRTRAIWLALAKVLRVDPGWLAFGSESSAAAPEGYEPLEAKAAAGHKRR